jgi:hypothetical protein
MTFPIEIANGSEEFWGLTKKTPRVSAPLQTHGQGLVAMLGLPHGLTEVLCLRCNSRDWRTWASDGIPFGDPFSWCFTEPSSELVYPKTNVWQEL